MYSPETDCELFGLKKPQHSQARYNPDQLSKGIKVESEHFDADTLDEVDSVSKATCIAKHHLDEMPSDYYDKLAEMEKKGKSS